MIIVSRLNLSTQIRSTYVCTVLYVCTSYLPTHENTTLLLIFSLRNCYLATNVIKKYEINHEIDKVFRYSTYSSKHILISYRLISNLIEERVAAG